MNLTDFAQLKKLLTLAAAAENDGEALNAFRAATRLVAKNGFTWASVLDRVVTVASPVGNFGLGGTPDNLDEATFERALDSASGSFRATVFSIYEQWSTGRPLTDRQEAVVRRAARSAT